MIVDPYKIIIESFKPTIVDFVIHKHNPRSGSIHYDLRFKNPKENTVLYSFAAPKNFLETIDKKTILVRTRDHDPRWLGIKSYRLETEDSGKANIKIATEKYFEIIFNGKLLNGNYKLFKLKTKRNDQWLLIKK